ncbi:MAG: hypothetical protein ABJE80_07280 [Reichenbachiella sp.]|uniref:hypothetical protein n=1 Tax=Reichenbachiella sp. TaxID=2184521 RepID=UPI0032640CF2
MINKLVAYDLLEVKKKLSLAKAKTWYKAGLVEEEQWKGIQADYPSDLYSPTIFMRILLFVATFFGLSTVLGPILLLVADEGIVAIRIMVFIAGVVMIAFTERVMIKDKRHFKSGITEAGYYIGFSFVYFGLMGFGIDEILIYWMMALLFVSIGTIRYMDLLSLVATVVCLVAVLFLSLTSILAFLPFVIMILFGGLFIISQKIQKKTDYLVWEDHFILFDTLALLLVYLGGNYFVVRELSIEMMGLELGEGQDIPMAFLFYGFTFLIPLAYLIWGIRNRSILFIRVSLLVLTLTVFTIKYYYSFAPPEVSITVAGGILILISLVLLKYLKKSRKGFIRDQIIQSKWDNPDLVAVVASQTLGGHQIDQSESSQIGKGGEFGGGGASGDF